MIKLRRSVPDQHVSNVRPMSHDTLAVIVAVIIVGLGAFLLALGMLTFQLSDAGEHPICNTPTPCQTKGPGE